MAAQRLEQSIAPYERPGAGQDGPAPSVSPPMAVLDLGRQPYRAALELQLRLVEARRAGEIPDTLVLVEHPAVITCGRGTRAGHILADEETLASGRIEVVE